MLSIQRTTMGMPAIIHIIDSGANLAAIEAVFSYYTWVDETFSTYKPTSEVSRLNSGQLAMADTSPALQAVFALAEKTKKESSGYFNIERNGVYDPSGIVKGWAINEAAHLLDARGYQNYYVEIAGDIQTKGVNEKRQSWHIGIRHPFVPNTTVKSVFLGDGAIATSGNYERGSHIYNPLNHKDSLTEVVSLTVIGKRILDADRYATAAYAMGKGGIQFIESLPEFAGYMIDSSGMATATTNFEDFTKEPNE